jgi:Asp/Glu/hydantoin racemase
MTYSTWRKTSRTCCGNDDVVLTLGAGSIGAVAKQLPQQLAVPVSQGVRA